MLHFLTPHGTVTKQQNSPSVETVTEASPGQRYCSHYDATNWGSFGGQSVRVGVYGDLGTYVGYVRARVWYLAGQSLRVGYAVGRGQGLSVG